MKAIMAMFMAMIMVVPAMALESTASPGKILPDSSLYFLDEAWGNIQVSMASGAFDKANVRAAIAEERIAEMEQMANENKLEATEKAKNNFEKEESEIEKLKEGMNETEKKSIEETVGKHILVLQRVLAKAPEQARAGLENALNNTQSLIEKKETIQQIQTNQSENKTNHIVRCYWIGLKKYCN